MKADLVSFNKAPDDEHATHTGGTGAFGKISLCHLRGCRWKPVEDTTRLGSGSVRVAEIRDLKGIVPYSDRKGERVSV